MSKASNLFLAARPAFLSITLLGCLIGLVLPSNTKGAWAINLLAIGLALSVHAAANLLNDYFDHLNGSDQNNRSRITPFTGGSRYIQNQLLTPSQIYGLGLILMVVCTVLGIYICSKTTWQLIPVGMIGVAVAWSYSAPPLELMSRGVLGEAAIAIAWSLLVVGFASLQENAIAFKSIPIGLAYGLMVSNILLVNQIPDIEADQLARKYTLATTHTRQGLSYWYTGIYITGYAFQFSGIYFFDVPKESLVTLLLLPMFLLCGKGVSNPEKTNDQTRKLIVRNMIAVHLYSLLLCLSLLKGA